MSQIDPVDLEFVAHLVQSCSCFFFQEQASTPWLGNYKPAPSRLTSQNLQTSLPVSLNNFIPLRLFLIPSPALFISIPRKSQSINLRPNLFPPPLVSISPRPTTASQGRSPGKPSRSYPRY